MNTTRFKAVARSSYELILAVKSAVDELNTEVRESVRANKPTKFTEDMVSQVISELHEATEGVHCSKSSSLLNVKDIFDHLGDLKDLCEQMRFLGEDVESKQSELESMDAESEEADVNDLYANLENEITKLQGELDAHGKNLNQKFDTVWIRLPLIIEKLYEYAEEQGTKEYIQDVLEGGKSADAKDYAPAQNLLGMLEQGTGSLTINHGRLSYNIHLIKNESYQNHLTISLYSNADWKSGLNVIVSCDGEKTSLEFKTSFTSSDIMGLFSSVLEKEENEKYGHLPFAKLMKVSNELVRIGKKLVE